ncbi:MAG: HEAT repeat domain-containing protein [bacterium]|nr:HEAT repeat domain-containing protein [Myxococcales bacterium]
MYRLRHIFFGTAGRRWATLVVVVAVFYLAGHLIHGYVDTAASSPGLTFALVALWVALGALAGLVTVISLGDFLFHRGFSRDFLRDEMAELDARLSGAPQPELDDEELVVAASGRDPGIRLGLYFLVFAAGHVLLSNTLSDGFMQRYSHPGVAIVHMRSDDPAVRRTGMNMLAGRLDFEASPEVTRVVLAALADPDEGVAARAAFVAGTLDIDAAADTLARLATEREALTFTALIALGQIGGPAAATAARRLADDPIARQEPQALALALGLLKVPAIERLRQIHRDAPDEDTRLAAIWALGQLRDERLFDVLADALRDPALVVRCAAADALKAMIVVRSYEPLRQAFEAAEPAATCPERNLPVQEGGRTVQLVRQRLYMLALLQALASTDHPALLHWLVAHQDDTEDYYTRTYMKKMWDDLKEKEAAGRLNHLKKQLALQAAQERALTGAPDGGPPDGGADGGGADGGARPDAGLDDR